MEPQNNKDQEIEQLRQEVYKLKSQLIDPVDSEKLAEQEKTIPTVVLYRWSSPARIFRKKDNRWFVSVAFVILVFILLFAFLQDILPIFVLVALMFLMYLLGTVEPQDVTHEVTNKGIRTSDKLYKWSELKNFWFADHNEWIKLYVDTNLQFPARLIMLVKPEEDKKIFDVLKKDLEYFVMENQNTVSKMTEGEYIKLDKYMPTKVLEENNITKSEQDS